MKKPLHRAMYLEDAVNILQEMERTFAELERSDVFQAFTSAEKAQYRDALSRFRALIHDLEQDTAQEQLASRMRDIVCPHHVVVADTWASPDPQGKPGSECHLVSRLD